MTTPRVVPGHRIKWFAYAGPYGERVPKPPQRLYGIGYDVECECGWQTRTGGAVKSYVESQVREHKYDVTGDINHIFKRPLSTPVPLPQETP